jgi:hypothetical protein
MYELRAAVMILVEASWEAKNGTLQKVPARMEDKSTGGACLRLKTAIGVGTKLRITSPWEQFAGVAKYCRSDGKDFLVGIQRDLAQSPILHPPVAPEVNVTAGYPGSQPAKWRAKIEELPNARTNLAANQRREIPAGQHTPESASGVRIPRNAAAMLPRGFVHKGKKERPRVAQLQDMDAFRSTDLQSKPPPRKDEIGKARKFMGNKWRELTAWRNKQGDPSDRGSSTEKNNSEGETLNRAADSGGKTKSSAVSGRAGSAAELLGMEDICLASGIMNPPRGYGIAKVIDMLNSEHIRHSSKDMKRAAVLMALNAAGIPVGQVLQDAKVRQDALDAYEKAQKRQVEAEWARRAEEIVQIQAEMENVKNQFAARISRNLEGIAREKATFSAWLAEKQQEIQSMAEAAELCCRPAPSEPAKTPSPEISLAAAASAQASVSEPEKNPLPEVKAANSSAKV